MPSCSQKESIHAKRKLRDLPAITDSALSCTSSFVGFNNDTSPFRIAFLMLYCMRSLINSHASYCTSKWRDLNSINTGSTTVGLAVPITGWNINQFTVKMSFRGINKNNFCKVMYWENVTWKSHQNDKKLITE